MGEIKPFEIGERAIIVATPGMIANDMQYLGRIATVMAYSTNPGRTRVGEKYDYEIAIEGCPRAMECTHSCLRRLPKMPDREDLQVTTWDKCVWKPQFVAI